MARVIAWMAWAVIVLLAPAGSAAQGAERAGVSQRYDPATDRTTLRLVLPKVGEGITLSARAEWDGGVVRQAPDSVALFVTRAGAERVLRTWDTMELIVQGDRAATIHIEAPAISARRVGTLVVEQASATIPVADLERLAAARAIVGRVGSLTFWIAGPTHDALREFAGRVRD